MSSGFDFYGGPGAPAPIGAAMGGAPVGAPTVDRWGLPSTGGYPVSGVDLSSPLAMQPLDASRRHRRLLYVVMAIVVVAVSAAAFVVLRVPHPIALPSSLADLPKISIPAALADALATAKHSLGHDGLHDVSVGIYGETVTSPRGLVVIAGRTSSSAPDFNQLVGSMSAAGNVAGVTVTPQTLTSGVTSWRCATIAGQGQSVLFCAWQGAHAVLFGVGRNMSAQDDADALEQARLQASLS